MKILIVDDAPFIRKAVEDVLDAYGHEVYEATNGVDALGRYKEVDPDVVLMDILMPTQDGISATKNILKWDHTAKIIVITAVGKKGLETECIKAGAKHFIEKPFKIKELLHTIEQVADQ